MGGKARWERLKAADNGAVILDGLFDPSNWVVGYAVCQVISPAEMDTDLLVGSDDGIKVWVNGVFVGATLTPQDEATLRLLYDKKHTKKAVTGRLVGVFRTLFRLPLIEIADADDEDFSDLDDFIKTIGHLSADNISQYLESVMDVDSYLDWLAVNTLVQSNDTYHKNYYLHNRVEDDRWEILPWDYDLTWGRNWNAYCGGLCDDLSEGTSIKGANQKTNRLS